MRGELIPEHLVLQMTVNEGETLRRLLHEVRGDEQFPLNEAEDELTNEMLTVLDSVPH